MEKSHKEMKRKPFLLDVLNLAAPQTWTGSITPAMVSLALSYDRTGKIDVVMALCTFAVVLFMQSAVNAFDDYADFVKGTDTLENSPDAQDAVIVYGMKPKAALFTGIAFLFIAALPATYIVYTCGIVPLIIGLIGAVVLTFYAFGPFPICYLPLGELFCGFVMGGLIPLVGVFIQSKELDYFVLFQAIPPIMGMSVNMFSNNGCDIARDLPAGRKTLACLIGQKRTDTLYRILLVLWVFSPIIILSVQMKWISVMVYALALLAFIHLVVKQFKRQLGPEERGDVMNGATTLVSLVGLAYSVAIIMGQI
ncbi:MAG: prenyltransferase [Lachnospiraceae bacterium]|nr:prenyltransferase [Lachnospiraceae bacterium]